MNRFCHLRVTLLKAIWSLKVDARGGNHTSVLYLSNETLRHKTPSQVLRGGPHVHEQSSAQDHCYRFSSGRNPCCDSVHLWLIHAFLECRQSCWFNLSSYRILFVTGRRYRSIFRFPREQQDGSSANRRKSSAEGDTRRRARTYGEMMVLACSLVSSLQPFR